MNRVTVILILMVIVCLISNVIIEFQVKHLQSRFSNMAVLSETREKEVIQDSVYDPVSVIGKKEQVPNEEAKLSTQKDGGEVEHNFLQEKQQIISTEEIKQAIRDSVSRKPDDTYYDQNLIPGKLIPADIVDKGWSHRFSSPGSVNFTEIRVIQIGDTERLKTWGSFPIKVFVQGTICGEYKFSGEVEYNFGKDPYGKWIAMRSNS
jgi:hypothetical protein